MEIVKKNILSIICGVIAIGAVVFYFVYVSGKLQPDLEAAAKERKSQYETLNNLLGKQRTLPVLDIKNTTPVPLPVFPTVDIIKQAKEMTGKLTGQSKQILDLAVKLNQRPPLIDGVFNTPKPTDTSKLLFRDAYADYILKKIPERLKAAKPPTPEDVAKEEQRLWDEKYASRIYFIEGREANREVVDQEYLAEVANLRETLQKRTAESHETYLDANAINTNNALWQSEASPPDAQVWFAQMATWVQTDLVDSIASLNEKVLKTKPEKDRNIVNAPVKHVMSVEVPQGADMYFRITDTSKEGIAAGAQDFMSSPTGRTSGQVYDVIKFNLVLKMDGHYVPALIQEMARGKFITVHKVDTTTVDTTLAREQGFYYGDAALVQVTLTGEALMLRDWTLKLCPEVVKKDLPGNTPEETAPKQ